MVDRSTTEPVDEFERLGRAAGASLRAAAPRPDVAGVEATVVRRRRRRIAATSAAVVVLVVAIAALALDGGGPERVQTGPTTTTPSTTAPGPSAADPPDRLVVDGMGFVEQIAFSADGRTGASATTDGLWVWDTATGAVRGRFPLARGSSVAQLALDDEGARLAVALEGEELEFWSIATGEEAQPFEVPPPPPPDDGTYPTTFTSSDGTRQVRLGRFGPVELVDPATGAVEATLTGSGDVVPYVAGFDRDASLVAVKFRSSVAVWDTRTHQQVAAFDFGTYDRTAERLAFLGDSRRVAFTVEDQVIIETVP